MYVFEFLTNHVSSTAAQIFVFQLFQKKIYQKKEVSSSISKALFRMLIYRVARRKHELHNILEKPSDSSIYD